MKHAKIHISIVMILLTLLMFTSCHSQTQREYYSNTDHYICVAGTISYTKLSEDMSTLYIAFDDMSVNLSDDCFKVVGENLRILQENLCDEKLQVGDQMEFMTAPKYFGDGYVMPIVSIKMGETTLLEFEEGVDNFLYWLDTK